MWRASTMCDATITVEGRDFLAHKVVLVGGSEFFYGAFTSGLAESDSAHVRLPDIKAASFEAVLALLYTGTCSVTEGELCPLLQALMYLQCTSLATTVATKLQQRLAPHNCLEVWALADSHSLESLANAAKETALREFEAVAGEVGTSGAQASFVALPHARLLELLTDTRLVTKREEAVHEAVVHWARAQSPPPADETLLPLFSSVRYALCSRAFFERVSTQEPLLQGALGAQVFRGVVRPQEDVPERSQP